MIYCATCGSGLPDEALFCSTCGTKTGTVSPPAATAETELFTIPTQPRPGVFDNPNWQAMKKYMIWFMLACFLWTIFNVFTLRANTNYDYDEEDRQTTWSRVGGHNLLFGTLPSVYSTRDGETTNETAEMKSELKGPEKRAARLPMIFRISYWVFVIGFILYAISVFNESPNKEWMDSIGKVTAFLGLLSVYLVFNDIESMVHKVSGFAGTTFSLKFTFGFWGLFLSFLLLMIEYIFNAIASFSVRTNPYPVQQNPPA
jgi:hypothetical protein